MDTNPQESHTHHHHQTNPDDFFNLGSLFLGVILVGVGCIYLAQNLGLSTVGLTVPIVHLWPVLVISAGLSLIRTKGFMGGVIALIVVICALTILMTLVGDPIATYVPPDVL